ncbi:MAG: hypothetical protein HWD59_03565 [Coxiellaceae bacterium]|nr:MAG: hypothetical protein HWD59_03565 [Coxiellaceae bacterium]
MNALRKSVKQAKNSQRLNNLEQLQFVFNAQVMTLINKLDESAEEHHIAGTIHSAGMMSQKEFWSGTMIML